MEATSALLIDTIVLLAGGTLMGALFKRIGFGTVLGYLVAGILLGPGLRFFQDDGGTILHIGELGVVFLLFLIGLDLRLARLWALRRHIFGLGLAQVIVTGLVLFGMALPFTTGWQGALLAGFGLALSSTAIALQILGDAGETNTRHGQTAFAVLLLQDLAVVPLLALLPVLSPREMGEALDLQAMALAIGALLALVLAGRFMLNPFFRLLASAGTREVMLGAALLVVLGSAVAMSAVGFSMAMGAFLAGVLLAESSYRHELQANIEPFRGLLLGLFFIAVGLSLDLSLIAAHWALIAIAVPALLAAKATLIYGLCRLFGQERDGALRVATLLPQGGEFGFVLFSAASNEAILQPRTASILIAIVTLSMALTPLVAMLGPRLARNEEENAPAMEEDFDGAGADVLLIGFSRFGQIVAQVLLSSGNEVTILDSSAERIRNAREFGFRIFFGSGMRLDVLEAAGIRNAKLVAVCTNSREVTDRIVDLIRREYPTVRLFVRSYDRTHSLSLRERGVDYELRETVESALVFGGATLTSLGIQDDRANEIVADVRRRDRERLLIQQAEGLGAGRDMVTTRAVRPEPLVPPRAKASKAKTTDVVPGDRAGAAPFS